jgi:hypothetical protein
MKDTDILVKVQVPITVERIKDLLCSAIEGGSNYWVGTLDRKGGITRAQAEYRQDVPFVKGGWLELIEQDDEKTHRLDIKKIKSGMQVFATKFPRHFGDFMDENDDAETGDVFLQCCIFGDTIYG